MRPTISIVCMIACFSVWMSAMVTIWPLDARSPSSASSSRQDSIVCSDDAVPKVIHRPNITWPSGIPASTGTVKVICKVRVDTLGLVQDIRVDYSQNPRFNKMAKSLAKQYRFEPKDQGGEKREFWVTIPILFNHAKSSGQ